MKNILLGVTGGIAAFKSASIVSLLKKKGYNIKVVMTENATKIIGPLTLETLSRNRIYIDMWDTNPHYEVEHISLADWADIVLIAPATYNIIGKVANGIADDMLTTILSGGLIGLIFGFILQRTRFCLTGGFRDMYIARNNTLFYAFLIAITVESIGVLSLIKLGIVGNPYEDFSVLGAIVGSYLFGIGIVLAGGCATGTWYRAGEGLLGSWVALFFI